MLTLERWILTFLWRNNASFCPACTAFPPPFPKHSKYSRQHFKINQLSYQKKKKDILPDQLARENISYEKLNDVSSM